MSRFAPSLPFLRPANAFLRALRPGLLVRCRGAWVGLALLGRLADESGALMAQTRAEIHDRSGAEIHGSVLMEPGRLVVQTAEGARRELSLEDIRSIQFQRLDNATVKPLADEEPGLEAIYYPERAFAGKPVRYPVAGVQHAAAAAAAASPPVSARWVGYLAPLATGIHHFSLSSAQTARLWIDGQCVASIQATNQPRESIGDAFLVADQRYGLVLELEEGATQPPPVVRWEVKGMSSSALSATRLVRSSKKDPLDDITRGLLATYYGNPTFTNPRLLRVDRAVSMNWRQRAPFPEMGVGNRFSVTWEGTVTVPKTGNLRIGMESEGGVRVTFDGSVAIQRWEDHAESPAGSATFPMRVEAGRNHSLKIEFFNEVDPARILVHWYPSAGMETPVMADGLSPATPPDASFPASMGDSGSGRPGTLAVSARPGLVLSDGSFVAQATESATRSQFRLAAGELPSLAPVEWVSRVYLAEIPYAALEKLDPARAGALLHDGDFIEGEFQSLDAAELRMSSILFGNHRVKRERVAAVVLRALPRSGSPWRIATLGGSLFRPSSVAIETGGLKLSGLPSGFLRLPERQLLEARREDKR